MPEYRTISGPNAPQLCLRRISLHFSFVPCLIFSASHLFRVSSFPRLIFSVSHLFRVSSLFNTRAVSRLQLTLCLNAQTAQALSQLLDHSGCVSFFNLCFNLKQCLMINYSTVGGMRYIKREKRILHSRIIRLVTFNQFIGKIFALPFDRLLSPEDAYSQTSFARKYSYLLIDF